MSSTHSPRAGPTYKEPLDFDATMQILEQGRGTHFDPRLLDVFTPIARELLDSFGGREDDLPRQALRSSVARYFRQDMETLLGQHRS
jgi:HD-GYP domain-containing protein (c-di-GMP phosphodiesterase class II)